MEVWLWWSKEGEGETRAEDELERREVCFLIDDDNSVREEEREGLGHGGADIVEELGWERT